MVGFLISSDNRVTAKSGFVALEENDERHYRARFKAWVDGIRNDNWYHKWNKSAFNGQYTKCFVFKLLKARDRIYGFLCHPKKGSPAFEVCILICNTGKKQYQTEETNLRLLEEFRNNIVLRGVIERHFSKG